jgi:hypothetical protein
MTDPRAALADSTGGEGRASGGGPFPPGSLVDSSPSDPRAALAEVVPLRDTDWIIRHLAERGVRLVTEDDMKAAVWRAYGGQEATKQAADDDGAEFFAALSGEATE